MGKIKAFFLKKGVKPSLKLYFIDAMGAMAQGLFASLLIGTILGTIGEKFGIEFLGEIAAFAKNGVEMRCVPIRGGTNGAESPPRSRSAHRGLCFIHRSRSARSDICSARRFTLRTAR